MIWIGWILVHEAPPPPTEWLAVWIYKTPGGRFAVAQYEGHGTYEHGPAWTTLYWRSYHTRADLAFRRACKVLRAYGVLSKGKRRKLEQWLEDNKEPAEDEG